MRACIRKSYHFFLNLANRHPSVALVPIPDRSTATEKALVIHMADLSALLRLTGRSTPCRIAWRNARYTAT